MSVKTLAKFAAVIILYLTYEKWTVICTGVRTQSKMHLLNNQIRTTHLNGDYVHTITKNSLYQRLMSCSTNMKRLPRSEIEAYEIENNLAAPHNS